jgi:hypothetical protein
MKKYRIVEKPNGFYIQKRFLGLFWFDYAEPDYSFSDYLFGWVKDRGTVWIYDSLFNARKALEMIKKFPIEYEGHYIAYGHFKNDVYIDLNSLTSNHRGWFYYNRGAHDLNYLKDLIHQYELDKKKKKNKNKILNVYEDLSS